MDRSEASELTTGRILLAVVAVAVFVIDRLSKGLVVANIPLGGERRVLPFLWLTNTQNSGAAFGFGRNATVVFLVASIVIAVALVAYAIRMPINVWTGAVLGLILGGTVGNGYDRLVHGQVTDFIALHWWPVFNVADSAISLGMLLIIVGYLLRHQSDS
jgi:signal peptidase II